MPHSSIYPLTYSKEVYQAVGRITILSKSSEDFIKLLNQANVLNFTLVAGNDPRSLAFIHHMSEITESHNSDIEGHSIVMKAAAAELFKEKGDG